MQGNAGCPGETALCNFAWVCFRRKGSVKRRYSPLPPGFNKGLVCGFTEGAIKVEPRIIHSPLSLLGFKGFFITLRYYVAGKLKGA